MTISPTHTSPESGPLVFGHHSELFGWLHRPHESARKPAIVICNPVGFEFVRAYRTLRQLADQLAAAGHLVLRFDYRTTGDSAGDELDASRVEKLIQSIREAVEYVAADNGDSRVTLIGLRLGATLAAKVAETVEVEQLVLWAPCESGALYVREQQIMAAAQKKRLTTAGMPPAGIEGIDAGGFLLTPETQVDLSDIKLGTDPFPGTPDVLLLNRDDIRVPPHFAEALERRNAPITVVQSPAFKEMMLPPQLASVPDDAIARIVDWLDARAAPGNRNTSETEHDSATLPLYAGDGVEEQPLRFGPDNRLFGILSRAKQASRASSPAVILLCGGATHRISANRMYVPLARKLAASGTHVLRLDLAGIGDSCTHDGYPPNKPYTDKLVDDVEAAMQTVSSETGDTRFILLGLCSGAYAAMQTALQSERVDSVMLINQLVFHASADDLQRLATGAIASAHELDFPRSQSLLYRGIVRLLKVVAPVWAAPGEWLATWLVGSNVRRDIESLISRDVHPAFLLSSRDGAVDALTVTCGSRLRKWADAGKASIEFFTGTDHTFSPTGSQGELIDYVVSHIDSFRCT